MSLVDSSWSKVSAVNDHIWQQKKRVLLIANDADFASFLGDLMNEDLDVQVDTVTDLIRAREQMAQQSYDAVVLDWPSRVTAHESRKIEMDLELSGGENGMSCRQGPVPAIVLSVHDKSRLEFVNTNSFRISGYVSKRQSLQAILDDLKDSLDEIFQMQLSA
jgi:hypothetical protein